MRVGHACGPLGCSVDGVRGGRRGFWHKWHARGEGGPISRGSIQMRCRRCGLRRGVCARVSHACVPRSRVCAAGR
eukprot:3523885-Prymnesium_polylepis.1